MGRGVAMIAILLVAALAGLGWWAWTPDLPREVLEAKYLQRPDDLIEVAGVRLHARDRGPADAPVLILLHGFGSSAHTFEGWQEALADRHRTIAIDLPGSGLSSPDPTGRYDDARVIEVITALMDQKGVARATLVGNSIGGRIAWTMAARRPDRVERLVLIAPDGFASGRFGYGQAPEVPWSAKLMRHVLPRAFLKLNLAPAYGDKAALSEATVDRYWELMRAPGVREAMLARMAQTVLEPPEPILATITCPVLVLWGALDRAIPASHAADWQRMLPHAQVVILPGLGHVPQEEAPERSLEPVRAFLDS